MKPVAIFGGTFSPPHNGHVAVIDTFLRQCDPETLVVMPTAVPPHKKAVAGASPEQRLEMMRLLLENRPDWQGRVTVSDWEILQNGKSYTYHTLTHFREILPNPLLFICGADMFVTLESWYRGPELFSLADFVYLPRGGIDTETCAARYRRLYGADPLRLEMEEVDLSSTALRQSVAEGRDVSADLPGCVLQYIRENRLYGAGAPSESR